MEYKNLDSLILSSAVSRRYFFTLPTSVQLELSLRGQMIHSADDLHAFARNAESEHRREMLTFMK
ncbi:MAG: hypothetical protein E7578_06930 [Ruminococcaceae bacterium]|nr:hypothetical protein [Oscillospiraceae bacterium]